MNKGINIVKMAEELQRRAEVKKDFLISPESLSMEAPAAGQLTLNFGNRSLEISDHAHQQIGTRGGMAPTMM